MIEASMEIKKTNSTENVDKDYHVNAVHKCLVLSIKRGGKASGRAKNNANFRLRR